MTHATPWTPAEQRAHRGALDCDPWERDAYAEGYRAGAEMAADG